MSTTQPITLPPGKSRVVALSGGIGGAKLALGLKRILPTNALTVIANTADDFEHLGLCISPDIDTLVYTLAGLADTQRGWGRQGETWNFMSAMQSLRGDTWFNLGDADLAMHVWRTNRLACGQSLTQITRDVCTTLDVGATVLPMSDEPVRTRLRTDDGWLDFQDYFVARQSEPAIHEISYTGIDTATPAPGVIDAITASDTAAIIICPSNPLISIEPILGLRGIRTAIQSATARVIAISPIIAGSAVKGPTAKMLRELGHEATAATVLSRYAGIVDSFIADARDITALKATKPAASLHATDIMMVTLADRERLAKTVMAIAANAA